jgi:hypothetical protein
MPGEFNMNIFNNGKLSWSSVITSFSERMVFGCPTIRVEIGPDLSGRGNSFDSAAKRPKPIRGVPWPPKPRGESCWKVFLNNEESIRKVFDGIEFA